MLLGIKVESGVNMVIVGDGCLLVVLVLFGIEEVGVLGEVLIGEVGLVLLLLLRIRLVVWGEGEMMVGMVNKVWRKGVIVMLFSGGWLLDRDLNGVCF